MAEEVAVPSQAPAGGTCASTSGSAGTTSSGGGVGPGNGRGMAGAGGNCGKNGSNGTIIGPYLTGGVPGRAGIAVVGNNNPITWVSGFDSTHIWGPVTP